MKQTLFLTVLLTFLPLWAFAGSDDAFLVATDYWPPFRIEAPNNAVAGLDVDLLRAVGKELGIRFKWQRRPWSRCLLELEQGNADIMTGVARTDQRQRYALFTSRAYYSCSPRFYAHKSIAKNIRTYEDLQKYTVGYTRDSAYFPRFDGDTSLFKKAATDELQLIRMIEDGRWEVMVGTDCQVQRDLVRLHLADSIVEVPYSPEHTTGLYLAISKRSPLAKRLGEIDAVMNRLIDNGTIDDIAEQYFSSSAAP